MKKLKKGVDYFERVNTDFIYLIGLLVVCMFSALFAFDRINNYIIDFDTWFFIFIMYMFGGFFMVNLRDYKKKTEWDVG